MAAKNLLPGFGGKYTSEAIAGGANGADVIDASKAATLAFQVTQKSGDSTTITVQQSLDGTNWATLTTFSSTLGTYKPLAITAGPFGLIRLAANGTTGTNTIVLVGWPLPVGF